MPLLYFFLWIVLNGRVTPELIVFGILISGGACAFTYRVFDYSPRNDLFFFRNSPVFLLYFLNLILEILKAAFLVMSLVFEAEDPEPVIVEFHSGFSMNLQNVLLANSITLTPGTITIIQEGDHFVVHCLRREYAEGIENSSFVRILRRLK